MRKSILWILAAVVLSFGVRFLLHQGIRMNREGIYAKFNAVFRSPNDYNTIFLGSSRTETHFDCGIFDSINGTRSYNIGMEGASVRLCYTILRSYLVNSKAPGNVILGVDHVFNYEKADTVFMYPRYIPYLQNPELFRGLVRVDKRFYGYKYFPFYSMGHMGPKYLNVSLRGYLGRVSPLDTFYRQGYFQPGEWLYQPEHPAPYAADPDPQVEAYVDSIALLCRKIGARLFIVIPPVHEEYYFATTGIERNILRLEQQCLNYSVPFYNYAKDSAFAGNVFFSDGFHLNGAGSRAFSLRFAADFSQ